MTTIERPMRRWLVGLRGGGPGVGSLAEEGVGACGGDRGFAEGLAEVGVALSDGAAALVLAGGWVDSGGEAGSGPQVPRGGEADMSSPISARMVQAAVAPTLGISSRRDTTPPNGAINCWMRVSSRGPEFGTGGEPQVPVSPYNELRGENTGRGAESTAKAFDASHAPEPGPPPPVSDEERNGVTGTETEPEPALGVGVSRGRQAEDLARPDPTPTPRPDRLDMPTSNPPMQQAPTPTDICQVVTSTA